MDVVGLVVVVHLAEVLIAALVQKLQAIRNFLLGHQETVLAVDGVLTGLEVEVIPGAHDDGFLRAYLLTVATENTAKHVDLEGLRIALLGIVRLDFGGLHADSQDSLGGYAVPVLWYFHFHPAHLWGRVFRDRDTG